MFTRLGGIFAPWMDSELNKISEHLAFVFMSAASLLSCLLLYALPATCKEIGTEGIGNEEIGNEGGVDVSMVEAVSAKTNQGFHGSAA